MTPRDGSEIAIVGMAGRFPGAASVPALWRRLEAGEELLTVFTDEELLAAGVDAALLRRSDYVRAWGHLDGTDLFDAGFFGFTPREADLADPQQRLFLECAWEALEDAGHDPGRYPGAIGVFAGAAPSSYAQELVRAGVDMDDVQGLIASEKDFLATRVAYKLDLRGPALTVQTACSTSLVAVHVACQSLLGGECDMALAGGVSVRMVRKSGYLYQEGHIGSPDGHCRAFDAAARGTVGGDGVAVVVLKRLADALADGDTVRAVIKGSAVNNDGSGKVGVTAPSIEGQARVIAEAMAVAGVHPDSVGYVEAHGTGTSLGDPIEVAALTQAFRAGTARTGYCALGSVKTNLGHLDAAAGITGLVKAALCLERRRIPPSLHFTSPNPAIDMAGSPFTVSTALTEWGAEDAPRRAGVSSFGIGGTNAHAVLEEAPAREASSASRPWQLLVLSARSSSALDAASARLAGRLADGSAALADAAYTLSMGRRQWPHRRAVLCRDAAEAVSALGAERSDRVWTRHEEGHQRPVVFLFPGQGAQRLRMGEGLCASEPVFRAELSRCAEILRGPLGMDVRELLFPSSETPDAAARLEQTAFAQPALFAFSYALARLWMAWGLQPAAMVGHSVGEYVAACLAGVLPLEEALALVALRGRLMQSLPRGAMLAVPLSEAELRPLLEEGGSAGALDLAAVNAPSRCVVSGPESAVAALESRLCARGCQGRRLATSHAFHSAMMDPILEPFRDQVARVALRAPQVPFISSVTGTWIRDEEATDPGYWSRQVRATVRFANGVGAALARSGKPALLEIGPARTLSGLAAAQAGAETFRVVASLGGANEEAAALLEALGRLWLAGVPIDWAGFHAHERRHRVALPTYPFERKRHWIVGARPAAAVPVTAAAEADSPSGLEEVMSRQLAVMERQLAVLRGVAVPAPRRGAEAHALPATPIQRWFLETSLRPHHFNQSVLLEVREPLAPARLEEAVRRLVEQHDALRLRAVPEGPAWKLVEAGPQGQAQVEHVDLSRLPAAGQREAVEAAALAAQGGLDLSTGPLVRVVHLDLGAGRPARLLVVAHHLAVDVHSWGILLEDLDAACRGVALRPATSPFAAWARRLAGHTRGGGFDGERAFWLRAAEASACGLPADHHAGLATVESEDVVAVRLEVDETEALVTAARARKAQMACLVLAALAEGLRGCTGKRTFRVDIEGHGREPLFDEVDVSRTVGWFTALFPLVLEARGSLDDSLPGVVERLNGVPAGGIGFGSLRYLSADLATRAGLAALPAAEIRFNYHGRVDRALAGASLFAPASERRGGERDRRDRRVHRLTFDASVHEGRMLLECGFSRQVHERRTVEALVEATAAALRSLHARQFPRPAVLSRMEMSI
jgi:phthiocerol/phenolphthiocerol synthesis type-I polyketide synthase E